VGGSGAELEVIDEVQAFLVELVRVHDEVAECALTGPDSEHSGASDGQRHDPAYQQETEGPVTMPVATPPRIDPAARASDCDRATASSAAIARRATSV